jgi:hypothetical protein
MVWNTSTSKPIDVADSTPITISTNSAVNILGTSTAYTSAYQAVDLTGSTGGWISATSSTFTFGLSDFTIQTWLYLRATNITYQCIFEGASAGGGRSNTFLSYIDASAKFNLFQNGGTYILSTATITANSWTHVAICRKDGVTTIYKNGLNVGSTILPGMNVTTNYCAIGKIGDAATLMNGRVFDYQVVNGTALYSGNFTPPVAETLNTYTGALSVSTSTYGISQLF